MPRLFLMIMAILVVAVVMLMADGASISDLEPPQICESVYGSEVADPLQGIPINPSMAASQMSIDVNENWKPCEYDRRPSELAVLGAGDRTGPV